MMPPNFCLIRKILGSDPEQTVSIYFNQKNILFQFANTTVVSRLIEGTYFDFDRMIAMDYSTVVRINKQQFISCLDRAILLIREDDKRPIHMDIQDGEVGFAIRTALETRSFMHL